MIKAIILQLWYYFREYVNYFQLYDKLILPYLFFLIDSWNCMPFWYLSYFIMEILHSKVVKSLYIKIGLVSIEFQIRFFFNIFITCILIGELGYEKVDFYEIWLVKKSFCQSNDKKASQIWPFLFKQNAPIVIRHTSFHMLIGGFRA